MPILMPKALACAVRDTTQPSLLDKTTTTLSFKAGLNTCSQEQ
nr:hypothetical protein [Moraxella sp. ZY171148]